MRINLVGAFVRNRPFGTEIAFEKGLRLLGHEVSCIDPSVPEPEVWDYDADFTIVFKWLEGEHLEHLALCSGKRILFQPDDSRFSHIVEMMQRMRRHCDYALTFDKYGAEHARHIGYLKTDRLIVTADPDIYRPHEVEKDIDVSFVGSLTGGTNHRSRLEMCQIVSTIPGIRTAFVNDIYDVDEIARIYSRSKVVLNHATDVGQPFGHGYGYQCRHFEAGFSGACLLSNFVDNEDVLRGFAVFDSKKSLVETLVTLLQDDYLRESFARAYFAELNASHRPEHRAVELVDFLGSL